MKFRLQVADRQTGKESVMELESLSEADAIAAASKHGVLISSITEIREKSGLATSAKETTSKNSVQPPSESRAKSPKSRVILLALFAVVALIAAYKGYAYFHWYTTLKGIASQADTLQVHLKSELSLVQLHDSSKQIGTLFESLGSPSGEDQKTLHDLAQKMVKTLQEYDDSRQKNWAKDNAYTDALRWRLMGEIDSLLSALDGKKR